MELQISLLLFRSLILAVLSKFVKFRTVKKSISICYGFDTHSPHQAREIFRKALINK